jgi:hypothetical protein
MKRTLSIAIVLGLVAVVASACDDGMTDDGYGSGYGYGYSNASCRAQTTCGTCTPVVGCGWCFIGSSTGVCVDGPDDCPSNSTGWTWDPPGCTTGGDAGHDAATEGGPHVVADASVGNPDASDAGDEAGNDAGN